MSTATAIEWATKSWGLVVGCDPASPGCDHCYAIRTVHRLAHNPSDKVGPLYTDLVHRTDEGLAWTGLVRTLPSRLGDPFAWRKPERIFVNSQGDLFHPDVPSDFIAQVFAVMALTPWHTYQILTKRHARLRTLLSSADFQAAVWVHAGQHSVVRDDAGEASLRRGLDLSAIGVWPLRNAWIGVSVEDQRWADIRVPALLETPAAVRWISAEPLLGYVRIHGWVGHLDWVVAGGESGPGARPMHPGWARSLRAVCLATGTAYLFKQWGAWGQVDSQDTRVVDRWVAPDGNSVDVVSAYAGNVAPGSVLMRRVGKKAAGRLLDGVLHDAYPGGGPCPS